MDEHYYCADEFHRCDGGGPGEALKYNPNLEPPRRWRTIVVDPPWAYSLRRHDVTHRARCKYDDMDEAALAAIPLAAWCEDDAHLYLWTTNNHMEQAHRLVRAWGFDQKTILTWGKQQIGVGNYYRNNTEHVLFAVKGRLSVLKHGTPTLLLAPRGRHSEKPQAFYDMVESMSPGPYLDVFARKQRLGWDVAGNEVYSAIPELAAKNEAV